MTSPQDATLERQLTSRLVEIAERITELSEEQRVLQRMLERVRREQIPNVEVTRKNSHQRVIAEASILRSLEAGEPKSVRALFLDAQLLVPQLKGATFRSYLHRLAQKGLIRQIGSKGHWIDASAPAPAKHADENGG